MKTRQQSYNGNWRKLSVRELRKENKKSEQAFQHRRTFHIANKSLQERERAAAEEAEREHDIALGNTLLNPKSDFSVKRRYVSQQNSPQMVLLTGGADGMTM